MSGIALKVAIGLQVIAVLAIAVLLLRHFSPSPPMSRAWVAGVALLTVVAVTPPAAVLGYRYGARLAIRRMVARYSGHLRRAGSSIR